MSDRDGLVERMGRRMSFFHEAFAAREILGWPNDPVHNAAIVYGLMGWPFDEKDATLIREEARARSSNRRHQPSNRAV